MAQIYLHIPFCKQACTYCNFHFTTSLHHKEALVAALAGEVAAEKDYLDNEPVDTIYFGGGTPSLLSAADCRLLLHTVHRHFTVAPGAEITLEANPDDITADKLLAWREAGINRLSIGVQSFFEEELRWMNRAHNAEQAVHCIELSQQYGFHNLSIDLIYGSPLLTDAMWKQNVDRAIALNILHLSCYALTVEEQTPLYKKIKSRQVTDVKDEVQARQFTLLMQWLRQAGYEHYEVSNFARPGWRSRHNSAYWQGKKYLGIGPSAHSYDGRERRWNIANNNIYIKKITAGTPEREKEMLTPDQQLNEYIMISLRTADGMDLAELEQRFGAAAGRRIERDVQKYRAGGLVVQHNLSVRLTDEGMLRADGIAADLFV